MIEDNGNFKIEQMRQTGAIKVFEYVWKFFKKVVFKTEDGTEFVFDKETKTSVIFEQIEKTFESRSVHLQDLHLQLHRFHAGHQGHCMFWEMRDFIDPWKMSLGGRLSAQWL